MLHCRPAAFSVPTLDGTLHVGGDAMAGRSGSAAQAPAPAGSQAVQRGPLLVVCYDAAHPGSRAMWREPASLDSLLKDAPRDAEFLLLPLNGGCCLGLEHALVLGAIVMTAPAAALRMVLFACVDASAAPLQVVNRCRNPYGLLPAAAETTAAADAAWMRQQLQERAAALQLPPAALAALLPRLHFANKALAALEGPLPALLRDQWQEFWPALLAVPVGYSGDAAELEHAAGPQPIGLPAPKPAPAANASEAQPAGQQPGNGTAGGGGGGGGRKPGGARPARAAGSNVTTNATQPAPSAPRLLAYFMEVSSFWVYERLAGLDSNLPLQLAGADCRWLPPDGSTGAGAAPQPPTALQGATALVTLSQWPSKDPAAPCSWRALLMGAARSGAAAVLFAAPPGVGSDLQQPDCEGGTEACGHPAIAAAVVGHRFGQALQLALNGSERVNVTFGGLRVGAAGRCWVLCGLNPSCGVCLA